MPELPPLIDTVCGDATGLAIPATDAALRAGGVDFLTDAFRAFGALPADNRVARITRFEACPGGSTGQKLFLSIEYAGLDPALHTELFVKFSRDLDDPLRDRGRWEMESEAAFAALSRLPGFPIAVPVVYFADYHAETGTGIIISERIAFGCGGIEPHHLKCMDHTLDDALAHYRAILKALARLAAAHRSGRLPAEMTARFAFDPEIAAASDPIRRDAGQLREQVAAYARFAADSPQLLPANIRSPAFIARLEHEVLRVRTHEAAIKRFLHGAPEFVALCHWNAHIDNGWFWRDDAGDLRCGLMDWGRVRQLNVAFALWGCLSGAELHIWDAHLDELLALFIRELRDQGGPDLDIAELRLHLLLYATVMGVAQLLEAPARILFRLPEAATASGPHDAVFLKSETARNQLHILTVLLNLWETHDLGADLDRVLARI